MSDMEKVILYDFFQKYIANDDKKINGEIIYHSSFNWNNNKCNNCNNNGCIKLLCEHTTEIKYNLLYLCISCYMIL